MSNISSSWTLIFNFKLYLDSLHVWLINAIKIFLGEIHQLFLTLNTLVWLKLKHVLYSNCCNPSHLPFYMYKNNSLPSQVKCRLDIYCFLVQLELVLFFFNFKFVINNTFSTILLYYIWGYLDLGKQAGWGKRQVTNRSCFNNPGHF